MSKSSAFPSTRPVHPCLLSVFDGNYGGEYSTWARVSKSTKSKLPNLVTAQGSTLRIYEVNEETGKLILVESFTDLAGNICYLDTLQSFDRNGADSLLIGFSGHPRLAVVELRSESKAMLMATSLLDLTQALADACMGSVTPLEQDLMASLLQKEPNVATLSLILGGGVAVAAVTLRLVKLGTTKTSWHASEPYLLPLATLQRTLNPETAEQQANPNNAYQQSIAHGLGDIVDASFLEGYLEPTLVLLHANSQKGRICSGRLGRDPSVGNKGTPYGLYVTAMSVTVSHQRSAVLWSTQVPADALSLHALGKSGCLILCVNGILQVSNGGSLHNVLAVNGWAKSTAPSTLQSLLKPNPWPFPKLSIQLDGSSLTMLSEDKGFIVLRYGEVYVLQRDTQNLWAMMPSGHKVGGIGQVATLIALPFHNVGVLPKQIMKGSSIPKSISLGLLFVGSRLGDSSLLGYAIELDVPLPNGDVEDTKRQRTVNDVDPIGEGNTDYEIVLRQEEDALYAVENQGKHNSFPDVIPPSSDEEEEPSAKPKKRDRPEVQKACVLRSITALDSITAIGPIGPGCEGPLSASTIADQSQLLSGTSGSKDSVGGSSKVFPCGYGSSGGLVLVTNPGRDDRSIMAEADCLNAHSIFSLPSQGLLLMGMLPKDNTSTGINVFRIEENLSTKVEEGTRMLNPDKLEISELDLEEWAAPSGDEMEGTLADPNFLFTNTTLLGASELDSKSFVVIVQYPSIFETPSCALLILTVENNASKILRQHDLQTQTFGKQPSWILQVSPFYRHENGSSTFGCVWSCGSATVCTVDMEGSLSVVQLEGHSQPDSDEGDDEDIRNFYQCDRITAIDIFKAPANTFSQRGAEEGSNGSEVVEHVVVDEEAQLYDEEEKELYGVSREHNDITEEDNGEIGTDTKDASSLFVAVSRQSAVFEVYALQDPEAKSLVWSARGCGLGVAKLANDSEPVDIPKFHKIFSTEIRFFQAGPTNEPSHESFFLVVETSVGEMQVYKQKGRGVFTRESLRASSRPSKKQSEHHGKLRRRGIVPRSAIDEAVTNPFTFRHNRLHRFAGISMTNGLFAATYRPLWLVTERNSLVALNHKSRHVAPLGGRARPIAGFCVGLAQGNSLNLGADTFFVTLHERIGRVGSQRLTIFRGLGNVFGSHGLLCGGGFYAEKIPLSVTVHRVQFIDSKNVSSGSNPLYALLISRELEEDQSQINTDGLTEEQRQEIKDKKEAAKIKRQVEADLGGFDVEQEWVEEIEREECFEIDMSLGGAPPIAKRAYALWIVDAANNWNVVDSYELDEFEHGMTMKIMNLTELLTEPGNMDSIDENNGSDTLFVTVGTGIVDGDGEDVASKGRVLLFEVTRQEQQSIDAGGPVAELSLVYEKNIFHGPVSSLSCLVCEGKSRLVIGAGADVNIEQWGKGRLTQVGFFRGNMQILDIMLFKTFFLLSDAYDSLYFLVWRESDTSLTLLAKDYEPIPVFAAGLLARSSAMTFVCHDDRQNLQFFQYAPGDAAARGGNKLVSRADIHLGAQTVSIESHVCRSSLLVNSATPASTMAALKSQDTLFGRHEDDQRIGVHFGTSDGGVGSVLPISERDYWRLAALQSVMANALDSDCALNPRAWRLYRRTPRRGGCRNNDRRKGVIDGDLVIKYCDLSTLEQEDLASAINSTMDDILDTLVELRCSGMIV